MSAEADPEPASAREGSGAAWAPGRGSRGSSPPPWGRTPSGEGNGGDETAAGATAVSGKTLLEGKITNQNFLPSDGDDIRAPEGTKLHFSSFSFQADPRLCRCGEPEGGSAIPAAGNRLALCNRRTWLVGLK